MKKKFELYTMQEAVLAWECRDKESDSLEKNYWTSDGMDHDCESPIADSDKEIIGSENINPCSDPNVRYKKNGLLVLGAGLEDNLRGLTSNRQSLTFKNQIITLERLKYGLFNRQERYEYRSVVPGDLLALPFARYLAKSTGIDIKLIDEIDESCSPVLILYTIDNGYLTHTILAPFFEKLETRGISYHLFSFACVNLMPNPEIHPDFCGIVAGDVSFPDISLKGFTSLYDYEGLFAPPDRKFLRFLNHYDHDFILYSRLVEDTAVDPDEIWHEPIESGQVTGTTFEDDARLKSILNMLYLRKRAVSRPEHKNIFSSKRIIDCRRLTHRLYTTVSGQNHAPLREDVAVCAIPEPDNLRDPFAVALYQENKKIGYLSGNKNRFLLACLAGGGRKSTTGSVWRTNNGTGTKGATVSLQLWWEEDHA
ncbi:MAG TPA: hypothetical protein PK859_12715 [Spirochaetota bacterium]|nr:hypothetical protein [Spirochaetota bacterium]HPR48918.1 hypothetical protein [Spirochaetota bacterium]